MENFIFCTKSSKPSMYCVLIIVVMFKPTHSVQSIRIPSLSGPYFPTFRQNTEIHSEIWKSGNDLEIIVFGANVGVENLKIEETPFTQ